jgi:hypothetical protein
MQTSSISHFFAQASAVDTLLVKYWPKALPTTWRRSAISPLFRGYPSGCVYRVHFSNQYWYSHQTTIFLNKRGLHDTMVGRKACSSEEFEDFFYGFSQSSPRFLVVGVGQGLQGADAKIKGAACFNLGSELLM